MSIKRRIKAVSSSMSRKAAILRMGELLAAGHGTEKDVETYNRLQSEYLLDSALAAIKQAEEAFSWKHMDGCFKQATEIFVLASILYEKNPNYVIMTDGAYDALAKFLLKNRDKVENDFWNWYNVTAIDLKAGTGMGVTMQAPVRRMYDLYLQRQDDNDGNKARVLRRPAKSAVKRSKGASRKGTKRIIRKRR